MIITDNFTLKYEYFDPIAEERGGFEIRLVEEKLDPMEKILRHMAFMTSKIEALEARVAELEKKDQEKAKKIVQFEGKNLSKFNVGSDDTLL